MKDLAIFNAKTTTERLPFDSLVRALEEGFATGCQLPERHHHRVERPGEPDATLLLMPAWSLAEDPQQYLGVKIVTVYPGNTARNLPGLFSTYILYDAATGEQLAIMDGNVITGRRTVATSALAGRMLARPESSKLLVLGAGRIGSLVPYAYRAVLPIDEVAIWSPVPEEARLLVDRLRGDGIAANVVDDLATAVHEADVVSAATLATEPVIKGKWIKPGTHVDLIGAFTPAMRESDDETVRKASIYVDTMEALHEPGDIVQPLRDGVISKDSIQGSLADLARKTVNARTSDSEITLFKAVGSGLADLIAARMVYAGSGPRN
ncbi:ornithine cyclodeaminase family protein [Sphingomonas histidinilytica]|uniref:ornithine cyclodeaminase family protein n=1 Tax=Rhizorhabdus histidinilytica TaxID=439228 RepID=UPI001ADAA96A|nr:ornithine cyclodeaminase family protein [Rhizorhabdus histidinilytica]MBO9378848.1 ornithine cyclodeaminase family protein [Rhizorhabdus histidinilytica]